MANLVLGAGGAAADAYTIDQSLRFNSADSPVLSRTPAGAGDRTAWTWSGWVKRAELNGVNNQIIFGSENGSDREGFFSFQDGEQIKFGETGTGSSSYILDLLTTQVCRDVGAWYHLVFVWDSDNGVQADRARIYVNGSRVTDFATNTNTVGSGDSSFINGTDQHMMGKYVNYSDAATYKAGQYLAEVYFIDGQALDSDDFGETDSTTNQWKPIDASGLTFGTNGFYQKYSSTELANSFTDSAEESLSAFTATGANTWTCPPGITSAEILVVAGGGGGPTSDSSLGGGGGAGGVVHHATYTTVPGVVYDITVGAGGASAGTTGTNGSDSVFNVNSEGSGSPMTAVGGGGGGRGGGNAGGSGGGVGNWGGAVGSGTQGDSGGGTGYGNNGGDYGTSYGGGGGGSNAVGGEGETDDGEGGAGKLFSTFVAYGTDSSNVASTGSNGGYFAGGGGSGVASGQTRNVGGVGGGGAGSVANANNAVAGSSNTGGGGGAGAGSGSKAGAAGGSGIVLIKHTSAPGRHTITAYGDAAQTRAQSKIGDASLILDGSGDYLTASGSTDFAFDTGPFTFEAWARVSALGGVILSQGASADDFTIQAADITGWRWEAEGLTLNQGSAITLDQWYHVAAVRDGTTVSLYVDGTSVDSGTLSTWITATQDIYVGRHWGGSSEYEGYEDEIRISDVARYTGNFTPSTTAFTADSNTMLLIQFDFDGGLGSDSSGNENDFAVTNLVATDKMLDSPTNNFCTLNPNFAAYSLTPTPVYTEGNLDFIAGASGWQSTMGTILLPESGKWYFEVCNVGAVKIVAGLMENGVRPTTGAPLDSSGINSGGWYSFDGTEREDGSSGSTWSTWSSANDIAQFAYDASTGELWFAKNNTWQNSGDPAAGTGEIMTLTVAPMGVCLGQPDTSSGRGACMNFGQDSSFAGALTAQGNQDSNEIGDFYYEPPTDFLALCTSNLPDPEIKLPGEHFNTLQYAGDGGSRSLTGLGFQPDFVWIKEHEEATYRPQHVLMDAVRGAASILTSQNDADQETYPDAWTTLWGWFDSFDSDGFSVSEGSNNGNFNATPNRTYESWNWNAGGSTVTNTTGDIDTEARASTTAGVSIMTYTGTGSAGDTIGHGLSEAPTLVITKQRGGSGSWQVGSNELQSGAWTKYLTLETNDAVGTAIQAWNDTAPSASVITLGTGGSCNSSTDTFVSYAFHSVEGYSKIGSFVGNNNNDGTFLYLGFRPAYALIKAITASSDWAITDNTINPYNQMSGWLEANTDDDLNTNGYLDFVSNGIKFRNTNAQFNDAQTYLYMAFAESPFKYANAR